MANYIIPTYPIRRPRYYNNQFLKDQDFIDDQAHQISVTQAHLRSLCVAGVCEGLTVRIDGAGKLQVAAGIAIDAAGHLIALDAEKPGPDASSLADGEYLLHVSFREDEDVMAPPVAGGAQGNTRWTQRPVLGATRSGNAVPAGAIVLGTFTVLAAAASAATVAGRQYSGIRFPGPSAAVAATATNRSDGSADGVLLSGDLTMRRDVPGGQIGPTLTLMNGVAYPGGASSGAAIDFDGYNPGANAPALRLQAIGDNAGSSHLAISTKQPGAIANNLVERLRVTSLGILQFSNEAKDKLVVSDGYGVGWNTGNLALFCPPSGRLSLRQNSSSGTEVFTVSGTGNLTASGSMSAPSITCTSLQVNDGGTLAGSLTSGPLTCSSLQINGDGLVRGQWTIQDGLSVGGTGIYISSTGHGIDANAEVIGFAGVIGTGLDWGVRGNSENGTAVYGDSHSGVGVSGSSNGNVGVLGSTSSRDSYGVWGSASLGIGVYGNSESNYGVFGYSSSSYGVRGESTSSYGVSGRSSSNVGVYGSSSNNIGVQGVSSSNYGIFGLSENNIGIYGISHGIGSEAVGVYGESQHGYAVYGKTLEGKAGYFSGDVLVTGFLEKSGGGFTIDHPLDPQNKLLTHSFVESPDMMNIYNGVATCDDKGSAIVQLPVWFEKLNSDYRYLLTPIGAGANLYVLAEVQGGSFAIGGGVKGLKVSWQVTGIRQDPWAKQNRPPVERDKQGEDRGRYLVPEVYGQPDSEGIHQPLAPRPEPDTKEPEPLQLPLPAKPKPPRS